MTMQKITASSPEAKSTDLFASNIEKLNEMFPDLITESKEGVAVNLDVLKALVGDKTLSDGDEKYGLNWHGKRRARQIALTPSAGTLRPCPEESVDWESTQNLMIEGDNLEVLKLLQKSYAGKVKLIYIDPPYNTGKDFVYPDSFQDNIKNYLEMTGQVEGGLKISSNTEASGRFHTDWLNMMYPRLKLARNLLADDGTIFVSIDENEVTNARLLLDEVFGPENFEASIVPIVNPGGRDYKEIAVSHEYIIIYSKTDNYGLNELDKEVDFQLFDEKGGYELRELRNRNPRFNSSNRPNLFYPFYVNPNIKIDNCCAVSVDKIPGYSVEVRPYNSRGEESVWRWGSPKARGSILVDSINKSEIVAKQKSDGNWNVYEKCRRSTTKAKSVWTETSMRTEDGTRAARELMGVTVFSHPKSVDLIRKCVQLATSDDDLVLDFFAGSGTTGHAVVAQNAVDLCHRRYILVQLPEPLNPDNKDQNTAAVFCDNLGKPRNIAELTKERLRRAASKIKSENPLFSGDYGFRLFKLDQSNICPWASNAEDLEATLLANQDHLLEGRTEADVLYELLLKLGLDLCVPIEEKTIAGKAVSSVGGGVLMACLAEQITNNQVDALSKGIVDWHKELAPAGDTTCVFRDSAFADDVAKTNIAAILEQHGIQNVRSL